MNCSHVRQRLPELLYGDLNPHEAAALQEHLKGCAECRKDGFSLERVRQMLDTLPVPPAAFTLQQLYEKATQRQALRLRRWRRTAQVLCGIAALLLLVFFLRLDLRVDDHQVSLRWGGSPGSSLAGVSSQSDPAPSGPTVQGLAPELQERVQLQTRLIHAVADDVTARETAQQLQIARLQHRLDLLQAQCDARWSESERNLAGLYVAQFGSSQKGTSP
jgi:DNA-binding transcriptional MerR regulator